MNRHNAHLYLPLVQALADGKDLEFNYYGDGGHKWLPCRPDDETFFTQKPEEYRIVEFKIEAGRFYKTRDGRKAFVASKIPNPRENFQRPFIGWLEYRGTNVLGQWTENGAHAENKEPTDLIDYWKE